MQARFHNFVNKSPQETLDTLFFKIYLQHPVLPNFAYLRSFLLPQSSKIYQGVSVYIKLIQNETFSDTESLISREIRYLCREILMIASGDMKVQPHIRCKLFKTLQSIHPNPRNYDFENINLQNIIAQIPLHLEKADLLAELPYFSGIYYTAPELAPIWDSLQQYTLKPDDEVKLECFLDLSKKQQILKTLENFIHKYTDSPYIKKACAVYITLGEVIPWVKHPFIRRLLAVCYQEAITLIALQK